MFWTNSTNIWHHNSSINNSIQPRCHCLPADWLRWRKHQTQDCQVFADVCFILRSGSKTSKLIKTIRIYKLKTVYIHRRRESETQCNQEAALIIETYRYSRSATVLSYHGNSMTDCIPLLLITYQLSLMMA